MDIPRHAIRFTMLDPVTVPCPYCGESIDLLVDVSAGDQHYVEDCAVCCRPIEVAVAVQPDGGVQVTARSDNA